MPWYTMQAVAVFTLSAIIGATECRELAAAEPSAWFSRVWQTKDGLPDNSISGVTQTADGYWWVATKAGLLRFNGELFAVVPRANFPAMPSRAVRAMFRDHRDWLWLGMERGPVLCLKPDGLQSFTAQDGLLMQTVLMMAEDREGAVWIAYQNQLRRILNGQAKPIALPPDWRASGELRAASDDLGNIWCAKGTDLAVWRDDRWQSHVSFKSLVTAISAGRKSHLWIAAGGQIFRLHEGHSAVEVAQLPPKAQPTVLMEDLSGALWIGTYSEGLFRWQENELQNVPTSQQEITCLFQDREGNILAGTAGGGLNLIGPRTVALIGREAGLPFESVLSVSEDSGGWLWAVAQHGQVARIRNGVWEVLSSGTNWPGGSATCVAADQSGGVWVGTGDRGLKCFRDGAWREWMQKDGLVTDSVRALLVAANGDVWVASFGVNRLQRMHDGQVQVIANTTPLGAIRALAEGADGTIWIGTAEGEIQKVHELKLIREAAISEPIPLSVRCLLATADGSLWIGYAGEGLGHLKDGNYHRLTTAMGLADDFISQILSDGTRNLWIAGNRGLWRASLAELDSLMAGGMQRVHVRTYGGGDGLPGMQPSRDYFPAAAHGRDGRLWFSTSSGLLVVEPGKVHDNPLPPAVQLERVSADDQLVAIYDAGSPLRVELGSNVVNLRGLSAPLRLGPGYRKLEMDFAALSFDSTENVQFRYRLSGFDVNWVEAGSRRRATYPGLPPGDYQFRVLACNGAGVWNETGAKLALAVSPFFWETWWFKVASGLATVLLAGGSALMASRWRYRRKLRVIEARRAREQERARIARDIHDDLGASLTRISLLSQPAPPREADGITEAAATLAQIHQTARDLTHAMGEVVWAVAPEHDTFDGLANYISHYAQNFLRAAGIHCRIEIPLQLPERPLSAEIRHNLFLAFKEALNNVVKHAAASEVQISLSPGEAGFELLVADNGRGFSCGANDPGTPGRDASRAAPGHGLANMRSRLREIGGDCEFQSETGAGMRVIFRVTLKA